jgi:hypothetical protein
MREGPPPGRPGGVDRDRLAEFLTRYRVAGQPVTDDEARAAADRMVALSTLSCTELAERGDRWLTVVHGDPDTDEADAARRELSRWADRHPAAIVTTIGSNDTTSWLFAPPDVEAPRAALQALAEEHNPGWWINPPHPLTEGAPCPSPVRRRPPPIRTPTHPLRAHRPPRPQRRPMSGDGRGPVR